MTTLKLTALRARLVLGTLFVMIGVAACGGGGGSGNAGLVAGTFTKAFPLPQGAGVKPGMISSAVYPFGSSGDAKTQLLYSAAEIGGSGRIARLRLRLEAALAAPVTCSNVTVRMGHTNLTVLGTGFLSNVNTGQGSEMVVLDNAAVSIPASSAGAWFDIPLATPFEYNGADNLVVGFEVTTHCSAPAYTTAHSVGAIRRAWAAAIDATAGAADYDTLFASTTDMVQNWMQFVFSGGEDAVPILGSASVNFMPLTGIDPSLQRVQTLYLASEIDGSGPITGLALQLSAATTAERTYTYSVTLGHTSLTALTATSYGDNITGAKTQVASNVGFSVPAGLPAGSWIWLPLPDGVFSYNGTDNLVVDIGVTAANGYTNMTAVTAGAARRAWGNTTDTGALGGADNLALNVKLRFHGAPVTVLPGRSSSTGVPFGMGAGSSSRQQFLYRASELGAGGSITALACRLTTGTVTVATNYTNVEVVLGHTANTTLSTTFANNMTGAVIAFSGAYALPAGLRGGDWLEIPLATPFSYDPTKNLVVQMSGDGASNLYSCDMQSDATLYANRRLAASNRSATTGTAGAFLEELRLRISR